VARTDVAILGGGVTGLAAGVASGGRVYEAGTRTGGLCASYHVGPDGERPDGPPDDDEAYRFDVGGGHWIFGGDPATVAWIEELTRCRSYERRAAVELDASSDRVGYPLQHHLAALGPTAADAALGEIEQLAAADAGPLATMRDWVRGHFGATLGEVFFDPFHERYTAGLYGSIAPQDEAKSPLSLDAVRAGARGEPTGGGYNARFRYPVDGLDALVAAMAARADVRVGHRVTSIDPAARVIGFADGSTASYERLLSTLPLPTALRLAGVAVDARADPHTSVLVVNVGAEPGPRLGDDHWVFVPDAASGFHRFGVYSNVDERFLPASARSRGARPATRASLYVERAFPGDARPTARVARDLAREMVRELQDRKVIGTIDVVDPTWIEVAYTWAWPGSSWRADALAALAAVGIEQIGRYGRWRFQGIADSIAEGLAAGAASA
jgi:protoporphyrinogen oxidase